MSSDSPGALFEALRLLEMPAAVPIARTQRFPADVGLLIRLLAGDEASLEQARHQRPEAVEVLLDAAEFYLLQVCFTPGIDSYRVLGINRDAGIEQIREHYRLLVRWLHPDRNSDAWQTVYLDRVNQAWRDLRHLADRAKYDRDVPETATAEAAMPDAGVPAFARVAAARTPALRSVSARTMHHLPARVLAALGAAASLALGWFYLHQPDGVEARPPPADTQVGAVEPDGFEAWPPAPVRVAEPRSRPPIEAAVDALASDQRTMDTDSRDALRFVDGAVLVTSALPAGSEPAPSASRKEPVAIASKRREPPARDPPSPGLLPIETSGPSAASKLAAAIPVLIAPAAAKADEGEFDHEAPPVIAAGTAQPAAPPAERLDPQAVQSLLEQFQRAYGAGDLIRLMALFTRDARNRPKAQGRLADDYRALFESSRARSLSLSHVNWWQESGGLAVVASFEAAVTPLDSHRERISAGDIYFALRREDDAVRIASVRHQERDQ